MADNRKSRIYKFNIIISIVIAFIAWVFVVYNYSPMKTVKYMDVPITYVGEDVLTQKGYGILESTSDTVDVTLNINRINYNKISAEDIVVTADVTDVIEGENTVDLEITPPEDSSVEKTSESSVTVNVVSGLNKDVAVTAVYADIPDGNSEPLATDMSYSEVSVLGAEENVKLVDHAVIKLNSFDVGEKERPFVGNPIPVDSKGNKVNHIVVLPGELSFKAIAGTTKTVDLKMIIRGAADSISVDYPETITIKGRGSKLQSISSITAEPVDLAGIENTTSLPIEFNLPDGVFIANKSLGSEIKIDFK